MLPIHVKTMANVDESRATNIIANAMKNITERTVNVSQIHTLTETTFNRGRRHFLDREFYILRMNQVIEDFVNLTLFCLDVNFRGTNGFLRLISILSLFTQPSKKYFCSCFIPYKCAI